MYILLRLRFRVVTVIRSHFIVANQFLFKCQKSRNIFVAQEIVSFGTRRPTSPLQGSCHICLYKDTLVVKYVEHFVLGFLLVCIYSPVSRWLGLLLLMHKHYFSPVQTSGRPTGVVI